MSTKGKNQTKQLFSYDEYLKEFLKVDPHQTREQMIKPYELGINLANKDIFELKKTLTTINATTKK